MTRSAEKSLLETEIIIWDEIFVSSDAFQAVDTLLQDLMQNTKPSGGKVVLVGWDFRQTLPIVLRGGKIETLEAFATNSPLWQRFQTYELRQNMRTRGAGSDWQTFLLGVGNGAANDNDD